MSNRKRERDKSDMMRSEPRLLTEENHLISARRRNANKSRITWHLNIQIDYYKQSIVLQASIDDGGAGNQLIFLCHRICQKNACVIIERKKMIIQNPVGFCSCH